MGEINPDIVALWISDEGFNPEFKPISALITDVLTSHLSEKSEEEISDLSEKIEHPVTTELSNIANQYNTDGIVPRFEISLEEDTSYLKFNDSPELRLLTELQSRSPTYFEHFCKNILDHLGSNSIVKGGTNDGGIDFIGFSLPLGNYKGPAPKGAYAFVVGQAKRYAKGNNITETNLKEFIGSATREIYQLKRTNQSQVGSLQPIMYAYWTTSDFHKSAKEYAREMGIWYLNGIAAYSGVFGTLFRREPAPCSGAKRR